MQFKSAGDFIIQKLNNELSPQLFYHCVEHVLDVYAAAEKIGTAENISADDMKLLLTAAWFHDSGFLKGAKNHEEESCRIARETLPGFDYQPNEIEQICGMIMATKIPQSPKNHLEEILADADLDYLGRDDFFTIGNQLFKELVDFGTIKTARQWDELQVGFLESHHYFTKTALQLRQAKKLEHLEQIKAKLNNDH
ncbi:MAG: HD domain-containing protein [Mucilaginibacter sp.]|uniref:HD domain-containing protein n=1 Tax=Mucilaginibacter sp. TaxID=1882438 RepID=UPI0034E4C2EA